MLGHEGEEKGDMKQPLVWQGDRLRLLDQTRLPKAEVWLELRGYKEVAHAIRTMQVRGAPAISVAAAYGIALGALGIKSNDPARFKAELETVFQTLGATRPTARNLFSTIERMKQAISGIKDVPEAKRILVADAVAIHEEQMQADRTLSDKAGLDHPHPLQHRAAGHGGLRHGAGRHHLRLRAGQGKAGLRHRNTAAVPGRAPHRLGAQTGRHTLQAHHRFDGGLCHAEP
jgi:hypothetical protein